MEIIYSHSKITDFIESMDVSLVSDVQTVIDRLEALGHELKMPYSKSLGKGLFELRITGSIQIRIIYAFHSNHAVLLNIFTKKTWAIPRKELEYARNILKLYLA